MSTHQCPKIFGAFKYYLSPSPLNSWILFAIFLLILPVYPSFPSQAPELQATPASTFGSNPVPDFRIEATLPSIVLADGTTPAISTIIVNPIAGFTGIVTLSTLPLPADLTCAPISPGTIRNGSGQATLSCNSNVARAYSVTIFGTAEGIGHNATATFTFRTLPGPDFAIAAVDLVSLAADTTATSNVTVTPQGGFDSAVNLTATAGFTASSPGDYTVTITGISKLLSHTTTIIVAVTLAGPPDFEISASSGSINIEAGNQGVTRIIVTPGSGFTGAITLAVAAPAGISCSLSPTSIQSSGTSTLTCNSGRPSEYTITIKATGGTSTHTATVNVHVATLSPAAPAPSKILGLAPAIFYGIMTGIIGIFTAGAVLVLRKRGSLARRT